MDRDQRAPKGGTSPDAEEMRSSGLWRETEINTASGDEVGSRVQPVAPVLTARKQQAGDIRHSNDVPPCDPPIRHRNVMRRHVPVFVHPG